MTIQREDSAHRNHPREYRAGVRSVDKVRPDFRTKLVDRGKWAEFKRTAAGRTCNVLCRSIQLQQSVTRRTAGAYILVLGATMLLAVIGFAALQTTRVNTRTVKNTNDWTEAGLIAIAGTELAPVLIADDPDWRTTFVSGVPIEKSLGDHTFSIVLVDEIDGDLTTGSSDPVRAYGLSCIGDAVRARSVLLKPNESVPLSCLEASIHCGGLFSVTTSTFSTNQFVSTGQYVSGFLATINGDVEAAYASFGVTINGTEKTGVLPRSIPDVTSVFDYYVENGTELPISVLPIDGVPTIKNAVLTPSVNSITGETNNLGIYVVDCQDQPVQVSDSRIHGTLVFLNAPDNLIGQDCAVVDQVTWEPALPNYPSLLVDGDMEFKFSGGTVMDESALGVNLNPPGAPFHGSADSDLSDTYPSMISGLVFVSSRLCFSASTPTFKGVVVSKLGSFSISGVQVSVEYSNRFYREPPPGFGSGPYEPVAGTWRWDTPPCRTKNQACTQDSDCCSGDCNLSSGKCKP